MNDQRDNIQANVAAGQYQLEQLRLKLIIGRLLGIAAGVALWYFVLGPLFNDNILAVWVSFVVVTFGGLWVGQMVTLSLVAGRR